ncbi:hypothetical protein ABZZ79_35480, partial [Streptomyces sp. NPDC006458]
LRSYDQVIKLEQERLVYQTRLRSRYGRAWRRKAPVESLMPLRLARYGVPLAETAPAGLAAAGLDDRTVQHTAEQILPPGRHEALPEGATPRLAPTTAGPAPVTAGPEPQLAVAAAPDASRPRTALATTDDSIERFADAYTAFLDQFKIEPTAAQWAFWLRDTYGISTAAGAPLADEQVQPLLRALKERYAPADETPLATAEPEPTDEWFDYFQEAWRAYARETGMSPDPYELAAYVYRRDGITGVGGHPITGDDIADYFADIVQREQADGARADEAEAREPAGPTESAATAGAPAAGDGPDAATPAAGGVELTASDRYYLAWAEYRDETGAEPSGEELSALLATKGLLGRGGRPIGTSNLRRHYLRWRVYGVWAAERTRTAEPSPQSVARSCALLGITAQYNRPVTDEYIAEETPDFERRWQALAQRGAQAQ